jgi:hypothetical protein
MKYSTRANSTTKAAHKVVGVLNAAPAGTVRAKVTKLEGGNIADTEIVISATNNQCVQMPGETQWFSFDVRAAMEADTPGSFATAFPEWEHHAVTVKVYDDADPTNFDCNKITFGGTEDQMDEIRGPDRLSLADLNDSIAANSDLWSVLVGYNYDNDGNAADQTLHTISFSPFLLNKGETVLSRKMRSAQVEIFETDGTTPLMTMIDQALETTLTNPIGISDTAIVVGDTTGMQSGDVLTIEDELISVTSVDSGTDLTVARGVNGTVAAAHGAGQVVYRSAADQQGVFHVSQLDTSALVVGTTYTLSAAITMGGETFRSTHRFLFAENEV